MDLWFLYIAHVCAYLRKQKNDSHTPVCTKYVNSNISWDTAIVMKFQACDWYSDKILAANLEKYYLKKEKNNKNTVR